MPAFAVQPSSAFPPVTDRGFPRFIQFQLNGVDVGTTIVETVNFVGDVDLSLSSDGGTLTVDVTGGVGPVTSFSWLPVSGDVSLSLTDAGNGLAFTEDGGTQTLTIPSSNDVQFDDGATTLVLQEGTSQVLIVAADDNLLFRDSAFNASTAGQGAILSLIYRLATDKWIVCGDLEAL